MTERILLTGAAGHAARGMAAVLRTAYTVRGLDLREAEECQENIVGSVLDPEVCRRAVQDVSAVVTCHMGRNPMAYKPPFEGLDISIRGTALLYQAMLEAGVRRVVAISSATALPPEAGGNELPEDLPRRVNGKAEAFLYPFAKSVEEMLATLFVEQHGFAVTLLRPSWIVYEDGARNKYGLPEKRYTPGHIDPHDIGGAVLCALRRAAPGLEAYVIGQPEYLDVAETMKTLGWSPRHRFEHLKAAAPATR